MVFDIGAGLANMGDTLTKFAGSAALQAQREQADKEKMTLANDLAMQRQSQQQTFESGQNKQKMEFEGGQNDLNRQSAEKRTEMTSTASITAAGINAKSRLQAAAIAAQSKVDAYNILAKSREDVAKLKGDLKTAEMEAANLSPQALDNAAEVYILTGRIDSFGRGGKQQKVAVQNRAAELLDQRGSNINEAQAQWGTTAATKKALEFQIKQSSQITSAINQLDAGIAVTEDIIKKGALGPSGAPVVDRWIQAGRRTIEGDPEVARLDAQLRLIATEWAKISTNSLGSSELSVTAQEKFDKFLSSIQNKDTLQGLFALARMDGVNAAHSRQAEIDRLTSDLKTGRPTPLPSRPQPTPSTPSNPSGAQSLPMTKDGRPDASKLRPQVPYATDKGTLYWHPDTMTMEFTP